MKFKKSLTQENFITIGKRFASEDIAREVQELLAKWEKDLAALEEYGYGSEMMQEFKTLRDSHAILMEKRSKGVSDKKLTVKAKNNIINEAWIWVDKIESILGILTRKDPSLSTRVSDALPHNDSDLQASIMAMCTIIQENIAAFPAGVKVEKRISEAPVLNEKLESIYKDTSRSKTNTMADTAEIDHLDGQLYIKIGDIYEAGRKAIRAGAIDRLVSDYRFQYLNVPKRRNAPLSDNPENPASPDEPSSPVTPTV
ncbi:hypothetical protein KKF34_11315 [Myxococcota bacterium]|nr:hypothetical protein [Myxococcota bacterium]MBU1380455.1 hypothetical protein [Myxococcota bacterium]MBU1497452.1 hypothetical protein [Myxococcota bacterium]